MGPLQKREAVSRTSSEGSTERSDLESRGLMTKSKAPILLSSRTEADSQTPWDFTSTSGSSDSSPPSALSSDDSLFNSLPREQTSPAEVACHSDVVLPRKSTRRSPSLEPPQPALLHKGSRLTPFAEPRPPAVPLQSKPPVSVKASSTLQRPLHPRTSQPSAPRPTPPPLGMRRAHTTGSTTRLAPRSLPTKQAAFKPPLARPPADHVAHATIASHPSSTSGLDRRKTSTSTSTSVSTARRPPDPSSRSSSPVNPEADSSYGDMPFDFDSLDEEMSKYD